MDRAVATELLEEVLAGRAGCSAEPDRDVLTTALRAVTRLRGFLDATEATIANALHHVCSFPEHTLADAARADLRDGITTIERAATLHNTPTLATTLANGDITTRHVEAWQRTMRRLAPTDRHLLHDNAEHLIHLATTSTPREFERTLRRHITHHDHTNADARLERQQRDTRLRTWTDRDTGMWHLAGRFDPVTALTLAHRIEHATDTLERTGTPPTAPTDPLERRDHTRALALAELLTQPSTATGGTGGPEITVVIELTTPTGAPPRATSPPDEPDCERCTPPGIDWGIPVEIPTRFLAQLTSDGHTHAVIVRNGIILHAPGQLDLGRTTRLANRAQRRALRALYSTCGIPGCAVRYDNTQLHHITWWRNGGTTDLHNLIPLCTHHHTLVHEHGWHLTLTTNRTLTIALPDGTTMTTGPPRRHAA